MLLARRGYTRTIRYVVSLVGGGVAAWKTPREWRLAITQRSRVAVAPPKFASRRLLLYGRRRSRSPPPPSRFSPYPRSVGINARVVIAHRRALKLDLLVPTSIYSSTRIDINYDITYKLIRREPPVPSQRATPELSRGFLLCCSRHPSARCLPVKKPLLRRIKIVASLHQLPRLVSFGFRPSK